VSRCGDGLCSGLFAYFPRAGFGNQLHLYARTASVRLVPHNKNEREGVVLMENLFWQQLDTLNADSSVCAGRMDGLTG
jgi:hypothetical protein